VTGQPQPGDRVRVTYEATVDSVSERGILVTWPGDGECAQYHTTLPGHATVEVLPPPTLAERMAMLAAELEHPAGNGNYLAALNVAAERIREVLAADGPEGRDFTPQVEFFEISPGTWSWQCNGGQGCGGRIGRDEGSKWAAGSAWRAHVTRDHKEAS
jgi:hypothetical protein